MRNTPTILALPFLLLLTACTPVIRFDFDRKIDFKAYKTFQWMGTPGKAKPGPSTLLEKRVQYAVEDDLKGKGFAPAAPDLPGDFLVYFYPVVQARRYYSTAGWHGMSTTSEHVYPEGTLVLEIKDNKSKQLVWTGYAQDALQGTDSPQEMDIAVKETIKRVLANFPPPPPQK